MLKSKLLIANVLLAAVAAGGAYWLGSDFRSDGVLGSLQTLMQPFMFLPYLAGAILGGNAHSPNDAVFFVALFVQFLILFFLISRVLGRKRDRV